MNSNEINGMKSLKQSICIFHQVYAQYQAFYCCHFIPCLYLYSSICTLHTGTSQTEFLGNIITWMSESSLLSTGASANRNSLDIQSCPLTEIMLWQKYLFERSDSANECLL